MARADRFKRLITRRVPHDRVLNALTGNYAYSDYEKEFNYLVKAMQQIDTDFTENTFTEGDRVRNQLQRNLPSHFFAEFDFQGSVTSDTHIKIHSDIDLLALHGNFVNFDLGVVPLNPYPYDRSIQDLVSMRSESVNILRREFPQATVDASPGKAFALEGGSLRRKIDVVIGNWWDTELWRQHRRKVYRGVTVLNSEIPSTVKNLPFRHNYEINKKDGETGGLRKVIRLLKTLKYDADPELKISSYDIAAIAWNIDNHALSVGEGQYLQLALNARVELLRFIKNDGVRNRLYVPNGMRKVFCNGGVTLADITHLYKELHELLIRIQEAPPPAFSSTVRNLMESRLNNWHEYRPRSVQRYSF